MSSVRSAVNFLFDFYEKVLLQKLSKFRCPKGDRQHRLSIKSPKNELPNCISNDKLLKLFYIFLEIGFSGKPQVWDTYNPPLISSDRAEIFTTDTLKYSPEVEFVVLISD
jgi:hypothetical protein